MEEVLTMDNEQWKSDGICDKCRRQGFCTKVCRANKIHIVDAFKAAKTPDERMAVIDEIKKEPKIKIRRKRRR